MTSVHHQQILCIVCDITNSNADSHLRRRRDSTVESRWRRRCELHATFTLTITVPKHERRRIGRKFHHDSSRHSSSLQSTYLVRRVRALFVCESMVSKTDWLITNCVEAEQSSTDATTLSAQLRCHSGISGSKSGGRVMYYPALRRHAE